MKQNYHLNEYMFLFWVYLFLTPFGIKEIPVSAQSDFVIIPDTSIQEIEDGTKIPVKIMVTSFMIGKTEITQMQYQQIMEDNPSFHKGDDHPVEGVTWWDAIQYCYKRSIQEGLEPCYDLFTGNCDFSKNGYRLPTITEWTIASCYSDMEFSEDDLAKKGNFGVNNVTDIQILVNELQSGTSPVAKYEPNRFGLYDMLGNVWEWCYDYYNAEYNTTPASLINPTGHSWGIKRTIGGGSFVSQPPREGRGVPRSSMEPEYSTRFTGFRVVRTLGSRIVKTSIPDSSAWFMQFNRPPHNFRNNLGPVQSLLVKEKSGTPIYTLFEWEKKRELIESKWKALLGELSIDTPPEVNVKVIETFDEDIYWGKLMYLQVEPEYWEKIYLMIPKNPIRTPTPVVITPYYDVDTPAGKSMGGFYRPKDVRHYSYKAVQHGYISLAVRWFAGSYGETYPEAVANLHIHHPKSTGFGKWVWDIQRVVDYLYTLPNVDKNNIGIVGQSLGSKLALYGAAMDERISVAVISEGGISFKFSNYDAYWYFGKYIRDIQEHTDQHELLGLTAPRPLLLIGGGSADKDASWYYINAGKEVYNLYNKKENIGFYNHGTGHAPTPEAVKLAFEWFDHFLNKK